MPTPNAQLEKEKGNASFKAGNYVDAIGHYTSAILADEKDYTFPLNRAAAYLKLGKNEDAERDCTTVLGLSAWNAKALYRRGQARVGIGRLDEGVEDFKQALKREPGNVAVEEELKRVSGLIEKREKEKEKVPLSIHAPRRRRVPIKIVEPDEDPAQTARSPSAKTEAAATSTSRDSETLRPVSTRSLRPETSTTTTPPPPPKPEYPRTFKDAKQARESSRPSRVGGGIFRASGESTMFSMRTLPAATPPAVAIVPVAPKTPPKTWFEFTRAWDAEPSTAARWGLILSLRPSSVPALFRTSLEPALLVSMMGVFRDVLNANALKDDELDGVRERVRGYMDAFGKVERFETVMLFLSHEEKKVVRGVWEALGVDQFREDVGRAWSCVWS
ncbi:RNA polymerase II-associated protein 3 [Termitomyces sp. T112]|nr:RNA polymerase II-associated protein 3 [Termitomyces sp. T112]